MTMLRVERTRKKCRAGDGAPGEWVVKDQPDQGHRCFTCMLEQVDFDRGLAALAGGPSFCGGERFCHGLACRPGCFKVCRAKGTAS